MELQIDDEWRIVSDTYGWIVQNKQTAGASAKTPGEVYWLARTYHRSLPDACKALANTIVRMSDGQTIDDYQAAVTSTLDKMCAALCIDEAVMRTLATALGDKR